MTQCAWPKCRVSDPDELTTVESGRTGNPHAYCGNHLPDTDGEKWTVVDE